MALDPEQLKRRQRTEMPRAPPRTLGKPVGQPMPSDADIKQLIERLVYLAERETLFTMTLEKGRLLTALASAGFSFWFFYNCEIQLAPGATTTVYLPVAPNMVFLPCQWTYYNSLPWWLTVGLWVDYDAPALPVVVLLRAPDKYEYKFSEEMVGLYDFMRFTVTNNHPTDTANFLAIQYFAAQTTAVGRMVGLVYLTPIVEFTREKAEELSGRPYP